MPPSQLKQLKASLRDHGVLGPQKSKKQKKQTSKDAQKRLQRNAALEGIRERFNPFEVKAPARRGKFDVATNKPVKKPAERPGVTRGMGEERRRETLLKELQSRNKVGGLLDRRFGENDPTMTPEQRAAERFARQQESKMRKTSMFNLENDSEEELQLTHGGKSLDFEGVVQDDFQEDLGDLDEVENSEQQDDRPRKRLRGEGEEFGSDEEAEEEMPARKRTKNEVMKEVMAKSKLYKAERQAAKEDDDELRAQLDAGMSEFYDALRGRKAPEKSLPSPPITDSEPAMNPARAAMLSGKSRADAEKQYQAELRKLALDARSAPTVRTKTEEQKATEEATRLQELETKRIRRMKGEAENSDEEEEVNELDPNEDAEQDDAEEFGLAQPQYEPRQELAVEEEDEFVLDDDLIASDSDADLASDYEKEEESDESELEDDGDDDLINGLVLPKGGHASTKMKATDSAPARGGLAYTFPCPQTHEELLETVSSTPTKDLPTIVQRIRALYHKGLAQGNQEKLDNFAMALTKHVAYLADSKEDVAFSTLESLLRHLHSMAKFSPSPVGNAFRERLSLIAEERPLALISGDLVMLTGISTIFPTSDHFHSVVTPAMLTIARYLGQSSVQTAIDLTIGAYCCSLALQYQRLAKRYVPEVINYLVSAVAILAPVALPEKSEAGQPLNVSIRQPGTSLRISKLGKVKPSKLSFKDFRPSTISGQAQHSVNLLHTFVQIIGQAAQLWSSKSSFPEIIDPLRHALTHLTTSSCTTHLPPQLNTLTASTLTAITTLHQTSLVSRRPLLLHNHRPLAIKLAIPSFIENFNPDRHYDPDRERAELAKLRSEHKKERKGAMRELRKDANFIAREQLREKKEKDAAYESKFKRLVAEIQGEEGREAKEYEKEKSKRKGRY